LARRGCFWGAIFYSGGLALSGLAMSFKQLWLLYLGYGLLTGCGSGAVFYSTMLSTLMNFRAAGRPGLGAGLTGFVWDLARSSVYRESSAGIFVQCFGHLLRLGHWNVCSAVASFFLFAFAASTFMSK